jgi:D-amino-acid oxidase
MSFHALLGLALLEPDSGVSVVRGHALFEAAAATGLGAMDSSRNPCALPWFSNIVPRFRCWSAKELAEKLRSCGVSYMHGFSYETVMIHPPHYLGWLLRQFKLAGGMLVEGEEFHSLSETWLSTPSPDVVVNCTGLGSKLLLDVCDQSLTPDRGQTIIIRCPDITDIWRVPGKLPTYVLPRGDGTVVLGGTHEWAGENVQPDATVAEQILERCARVLPLLRDPTKYVVLEHCVGFRPARSSLDTVQRIEVDEDLTAEAARAIAASSTNEAAAVSSPLVVHSYGHGGDGFQSSWGSAMVVVQLCLRHRPQLFDHMRKHLFAMRHGQYSNGIVERAMKQEPRSKL